MAGAGELVNNLQNTQRKKPHSYSRSNPAKVKQSPSIGEKAPVVLETQILMLTLSITRGQTWGGHYHLQISDSSFLK